MARPVEFTRDEVLDRAMQTFWDHGYQGTSMASLTRATALNPGSIYAAFRSKQGLFLAALDHYAARSVERLRQCLAGAGSPLQGIRQYFEMLADEIASEQGRRGCLLVNTVLELSRQDTGVQEHVNQHLHNIEALFHEALASALDRGELRDGQDPAVLSSFLMTSIWGLRVLAGTAPSRATVMSVVEQTMRCLQPTR